MFYLEELFIEIGERIKTAVVTNRSNIILRVYQLLAGIANPYLIQKINIGFLGAFLKVVAERRNTHGYTFCNIMQRNRLLERIDGILQNFINALFVF